MANPELRRRLALWLEGAGAITDPRWSEAVESVPREVLVPAGWGWFQGGGRFDSTECSHDEWLEIVNRDVTIVTRADADGAATSSSTMPSIVAKMLHFLQVEDGQDLLEIGTGSGYSTALLCQRLRPEHVTSIDNQARLVALARQRLKAIGYDPRAVPGDGATGHADGAPYDRVIGTCFTWPVPPEWIRQTRPGGRVVATVAGGVVGLDVDVGRTARGHFHPDPIGFMRMQGYTRPEIGPSELEHLMAGTSTTRDWRYPPSVMAAGGAEASFSLLAHAVIVPYLYPGVHDSPVDVVLHDPLDRSWARIQPRATMVEQGGPRRIWDEIEALYEQWCRLGAPNRARFGLTVEPDGRHILWLDDPESKHRWDLTPANARTTL